MHHRSIPKQCCKARSRLYTTDRTRNNASKIEPDECRTFLSPFKPTGLFWGSRCIARGTFQWSVAVANTSFNVDFLRKKRWTSFVGGSVGARNDERPRAVGYVDGCLVDRIWFWQLNTALWFSYFCCFFVSIYCLSCFQFVYSSSDRWSATKFVRQVHAYHRPVIATAPHTITYYVFGCFVADYGFPAVLYPMLFPWFGRLAFITCPWSLTGDVLAVVLVGMERASYTIDGNCLFNFARKILTYIRPTLIVR